LDAREDVLPTLWARAIDIELAEVRIREHLPVRAKCLLKDLSAVCDEEQRGSRANRSLRETPVVEGSNHRLPGPGRGNEEVAVSVVDRSCRIEVVEHALLKWVGADLEPGQADRDAVVL